jgi:membrane dipeptidase
VAGAWDPLGFVLEASEEVVGTGSGVAAAFAFWGIDLARRVLWRVTFLAMMTFRFLLVLFPALVGLSAAQQADEHLGRARRILAETPLIDGHNDLPWAIREFADAPRSVDGYDITQTAPGHTDLDRLRSGMLGAQFWSVYIPSNYGDSGFARVQLEQIDIARQFIAKYSGYFEMAEGASDIERIFGEDKIASMLGVEGGHAIENSLGALRAYYDLGVRYMTLTHGRTIDWADSGTDEPRHGGLTPFGEEVVREMNRLGMLVDLSHVSPGTMSDALNVAEAPVIFSHSSARAVTDVPRNVPDSILQRLPENGGVVMVTFVGGFVSQAVANHSRLRRERLAELRERFGNDTARVEREIGVWDENSPTPSPTIGDVVGHIEHVRRIAGVDHVGIGSDYDGTSLLPVGLEDVSTYPALFAALSRRGWSDEELRKLAGENLLRAMREAERVARKLKRERPPSTKTIAELDGPIP